MTPLRDELMTAGTRSFSAVIGDVLGHIQEMVRLEVRLARTELRDEVAKAASAGTLLAAGAVCALYGALFVMVAVVLGLTAVLPAWAAALAVGASLVAAAAITVRVGLRRWRLVDPVPDQTIRNVKEQVAWSKQQFR